ncbi:SDR family oxidoreductase [Arthrobacter sp. zg-Y1171]|uniref:SDR family oxidoreductase n=1 Tax=Arthrobacter sp. zg-Y1171 TaxID=2964610 RepID=UPI002107CE14|nr:SDR family oxidoreductase [Arthrobacter sp. zg-Y1171]MCQ1993959.1 SDR family oxidoreductase [Arthrobacter sp. zg-Y1171]UWX81926.1 SDR family oxidoreductase [Arthrobacter sp. zg-Y1171]
MTESQHILVTGATGYIGGRLVPLLLEDGHRVRVLARSPEKLSDVPWASEVEIVQGDLSDRESAAAAFAGIDTLYFLVHSMASGKGFGSQESEIAHLVADAAAEAGVQRIVYLGGLHPEEGELSPHMKSRTEVGRILLEGEVPAIVYQAGVVIGSGSASFEMIRHLTETLPVMPAPSWVRRSIEPIAVRDVLHYLVRAVDIPAGMNRTFDIGSREVLTYAEIMNGYAEEAGLPRRRIYALPLPAPRLAGHWVSLVTPIPRSMALPLVESLQHDAVAKEHDIDQYLPQPEGGLTDYHDAVKRALGKEKRGEVETTWANASASSDLASDPLPSDPDWAGQTVYVDSRQRRAAVDPAAVWQVIEGVGGRNGWYSLPMAWAIRGVLDKTVGGAGLTRGRRNPTTLFTGDVVDWWRVELLERGTLLRLRAEMRVPGKAWLEMRVDPDGEGGSLYRQRAIYFPKGLGGKLYWWLIAPFHGLIFPSMAKNITRQAARLTTPAAPGTAV